MAKKDKPVAMEMERMSPTLHLDETDLPEIRDWKVGETYTVVLKVKQTGLHKGDMMDGGKGKFSADFKVESVSVEGEDSPKEDAGESKDVETSESDKAKATKVAQAVKRRFNK